MAQNGAVLQNLVAAIGQGGVRVVDLTQPLSADTPVLQLPPVFAPSKPFAMEEISRYDDRGPRWYWNNIECGEHTGTHFDAPIHWVSGKDFENNATDTIPADRFIGPACVIDMTAEARQDPNYLLNVDHLKAWEEKHGRIAEDSWILIRSDWSKRKSAEDFLNMKEDGAHTPGLHPDAVHFLAHERNVRGVGVETVGTDAGQAPNLTPMFPCHEIMHGSNKYGLASLTNLDQLPATGAIVIAPPLKIVNGSGSPVRVLALVPAA